MLFLKHSTALLCFILFLSCSSKTEEQSIQEQTIELCYISWACDCANWATIEDIKRYGYDNENDSLAKHCIFIEPDTNSTPLPDSLKRNNSSIKLKGYFLPNKGYPKGYFSIESVESARVFRYSRYETIKTFNKKNTSQKHACHCCGYKTLSEESNGSYKICPVCFWEDDSHQNEDPNYKGGANDISLNEAKKNFATFGACEKEMIKNVRKPFKEEIPNKK